MLLYAPLFKPVVSVADEETQVDLSDEDREALFAELPFHFLSSLESDTEVADHLNTSPSNTYPIPQVPETSRRSAAFCTPLKAKLQILISEISASIATTNSFVCPSDTEEQLRDSHTSRTCPERPYQFSPFYIEHSKEEGSDFRYWRQTRPVLEP